MNYELAQELNKAGFPEVYIGRDITLNEPYAPTLSELIEACGEDFGSLHPLHKAGKISSWAAQVYDLKGIREQRGSTPEEAVARLWLALNPKQK
jgi:hypothetical protein